MNKEIENLTEITILPEDARKCGGYMDTHNCLLATALKRMFPNQRISAGGDIFLINGIFFSFSGLANRSIYQFYTNRKAVVTEPIVIKVKRGLDERFSK